MDRQANEPAAALPGSERESIKELHAVLAVSLRTQITDDQLKAWNLFLTSRYDDVERKRREFDHIWWTLERKELIRVGDYRALKHMFECIQAFNLNRIVDAIEERMITAGPAYDSWLRDEATINNEEEMQTLVNLYKQRWQSDVASIPPGVLCENAAFCLIRKEIGGTVRSPDGRLVLEIPPNAIPEDNIIWAVIPFNMQIHILQPVDGPNQPYRYGLQNNMTEYMCAVLLGPRMSFTPGIPVKLTLKCPGLPPDVLATNSMELHKRRDDSNGWDQVGSCLPSTDGNKLQASLTSFSRYILGMPESSTPQRLYIHVMVETPVRYKCEEPASSGNQVYITLNDYNYLEEFVLYYKINVAREGSLCVDPNSDLKLTWKGEKSGKISLVSGEPSEVTVQKSYIQSLAQQPVLVKFPPLKRYRCQRGPSQECENYDDDEFLIIEQNDEQLMEFLVSKKADDIEEKADDIEERADDIKGRLMTSKERLNDIRGQYSGFKICFGH